MNEGEKLLLSGFLNHTILVAEKFINKVKTGLARSIETYKDLQEIREEAELLRERLDLKKSEE